MGGRLRRERGRSTRGRASGIRASGHPGIRASGHPDIRTSGHPCRGRRGGPLAAALLLLLADEVGDGAGDAAYQGPVLVEADAAVVVGVQVLDELVSSLPVPCVLGRNRGEQC